MRATTAALSLATGLAALALSGCAGTAARDDRQAAFDPIRPLSECLDPSLARGWSRTESDELVVDAGRRHYRITLTHSCPDLTGAVALRFKTAGGLDRICGHIGEEILLPDRFPGPPCQIRRVELIDEATYDAIENDTRGEAQATARRDG